MRRFKASSVSSKVLDGGVRPPTTRVSRATVRPYLFVQNLTIVQCLNEGGSSGRITNVTAKNGNIVVAERVQNLVVSDKPGTDPLQAWIERHAPDHDKQPLRRAVAALESPNTPVEMKKSFLSRVQHFLSEHVLSWVGEAAVTGVMEVLIKCAGIK